MNAADREPAANPPRARRPPRARPAAASPADGGTAGSNTRSDGGLLALLGDRQAIDAAIGRCAAQLVRDWMLRSGRAWLRVDDENRSLALSDDGSALLDIEALDLAVGNLPATLVRYRRIGNARYHAVMLADLNTYLGTDN